MTRYCFIIAFLLIHSRSTNAGGSYNHNILTIRDHLREEGGDHRVGRLISNVCSSVELLDILCDRLNNNQKQSVCDKIMLQVMDRYNRSKFVSFEETNLPLPRIVGSGDPYKCEDRTIEKLNIKKRMFWCRSRRFNKVDSIAQGKMEGFFCAGSRITDGRVFAFRRPVNNSHKVSPFAEMDDVSEILQYVPGYGGLIINNLSLNPSSSSDSSEEKERGRYTD